MALALEIEVESPLVEILQLCALWGWTSGRAALKLRLSLDALDTLEDAL
jgi:hypothetical protein